MENKPVFRCEVVIIREKTAISQTSGSVTTSTRGRHTTVTNNINTDVVLKLLLEHSNGEFKTYEVVNETIEAPVGQKILMAFLGDKPCGYQVTPTGVVRSLGYTSGNSSLSAQDFWICIMPGGGTLLSLVMLYNSETYYQDGEMKAYRPARVAGLVSLLGVASACLLMNPWFGYFAGTAAFGVLNAVMHGFHHSKENAGRKRMFEDIRDKFGEMSSVLA